MPMCTMMMMMMMTIVAAGADDLVRASMVSAVGDASMRRAMVPGVDNSRVSMRAISSLTEKEREREKREEKAIWCVWRFYRSEAARRGAP